MDSLKAYYMIFHSSEVFISIFINNNKTINFTKKYTMHTHFFCFLGNVLISVYTTYIQKNNNFRLVDYSPAYCLK